MELIVVPKDIRTKATDIFLITERSDDGLGAFVLQEFLSLIEHGDMTTRVARALLSDRPSRLAFIEDFKASREEQLKQQNQKISAVNRKLIESIHANSEKALTGQAAMRSEFAALFSELHGHVQDIKVAAQENISTAAEIHAATKGIRDATDAIKSEIPKIASNSATAANATKWRSSFVTAGIVSPIAVITGILGNKFTGWLDGATAPQKPVPYELRLEIGQMGFCTPPIDLAQLQSGKTITLSGNSGTLCLVLPPSAANQDGAGQQKPAHEPPQHPGDQQPLHHRRPHHRRHHRPDHCNH